MKRLRKCSVCPEEEGQCTGTCARSVRCEALLKEPVWCSEVSGYIATIFSCTGT